MKTIAGKVGYCGLNEQEKKNEPYFIIFYTKDKNILMKKVKSAISIGR
jgi:hypothetical protein